MCADLSSCPGQITCYIDVAILITELFLLTLYIKVVQFSTTCFTAINPTLRAYPRIRREGWPPRPHALGPFHTKLIQSSRDESSPVTSDAYEFGRLGMYTFLIETSYLLSDSSVKSSPIASRHDQSRHGLSRLDFSVQS
jgi:hypothetical protein